MRKDLGAIPAVYPMPVLMIASYDENGTVDVMNAAWGTICGMDKIALCIGGHKTNANIEKTKAFTVALADAAHLKEADFFGIASAGKMADKFERTGMTATKSERVNAPIIEEFPVTMECELLEDVRTDSLHMVVGKIVNVTADEKVLDEKGNVDVEKLDAIIFDQFGRSYFTTGEKLAGAWNAGMELMK
ncbi:MAG: flavin reductase family protein [Clostridia bacterium]|nr:flavin reductase family protein [Clostridia bacterium]